jgi:hypothetical protein
LRRRPLTNHVWALNSHQRSNNEKYFTQSSNRGRYRLSHPLTSIYVLFGVLYGCHGLELRIDLCA